MSDPPTSCFPDIDEQWFLKSVREDASPEGPAFRVVLEGHMKPLAAYLRASSLRDLGDPDEIVMSFLLGVLGDPRNFRESMERWAASGVALRRWLMNGLLVYVRARMKERSRKPLPTSDALAESDEALPLERRWERALAWEIMQACFRKTQLTLIAEGRGREWDMFMRHVSEGIPLAELAIQFGVPAKEVQAIVRRVCMLVRADVRQRLDDLNDPSQDDLD